jgi:hypothetical protein
MTENNFSLKDMIIEVRNEQKVSNEAHIKMAVTLENMELSMKKFLAIAEDHEARLQRQEGFQGKALMVWGFAVFVMTAVANKVLANINL